MRARIFAKWFTGCATLLYNKCMKILQTGDLHLGKIFYEELLLEDQIYILQQITDEIVRAKNANDAYDVILICGDIYDRSTPPAEAVPVFSKFLAKLKSIDSNITIIIISGNHDSSARLSFGEELLEAQNIFIRTNLSALTKPIIVKNVAFYALPFITQQMAQSLDIEQTSGKIIAQNELVASAVQKITASMDKSMPTVLCAHLFATGGVSSNSERILWGNAEQVDVHLFDAFNYTALGHLHRYQKASTKACYAGSPLVYSFDECVGKKCMLSVTIDDKKNEPLIEQIELLPMRKAISLEGSFADFYEKDTFDAYKDFYTEIICTDSTIIENPVPLLRTKFKHLMSFKQKQSNISQTNENLEKRRKAVENAPKSIVGHFEVFLDELYAPKDQDTSTSMTKMQKSAQNALEFDFENAMHADNLDKQNSKQEEIALFESVLATTKDEISETT